jgi:secondary thiamine-phosphate synthase enzyme
MVQLLQRKIGGRPSLSFAPGLPTHRREVALAFVVTLTLRIGLIFSLSSRASEATRDLSSPDAMSAKPISTTHRLKLRTSRRTQLQNVTDQIESLVSASGCLQGVCHLYVPHTTAAVMVNEGYDPDVARDMEAMFDRLIRRQGDYRHAEGNSDSHIKTALIGASETIWIADGRLALGRWQVIFFAEFDGPRSRELLVKIVPDT